ncbi:hypothetical protein ACS0TY_015761 [Phlomoides rotata]
MSQNDIEKETLSIYEAELHALRLTRKKEVEVMSKLERERMEFDREKDERKIMMSNRNILMTMMAKDHLTLEDEEMKHYLIGVVFKK